MIDKTKLAIWLPYSIILAGIICTYSSVLTVAPDKQTIQLGVGEGLSFLLLVWLIVCSLKFKDHLVIILCLGIPLLVAQIVIPPVLSQVVYSNYSMINMPPATTLPAVITTSLPAVISNSSPTVISDTSPAVITPTLPAVIPASSTPAPTSPAVTATTPTSQPQTVPSLPASVTDLQNKMRLGFWVTLGIVGIPVILAIAYGILSKTGGSVEVLKKIFHSFSYLGVLWAFAVVILGMAAFDDGIASFYANYQSSDNCLNYKTEKGKDLVLMILPIIGLVMFSLLFFYLFKHLGHFPTSGSKSRGFLIAFLVLFYAGILTTIGYGGYEFSSSPAVPSGC